MDNYPRLLDTNAKSRVMREKKKIMIFSRCMQEEHPSVLKDFEKEYCLLSVCPEAEHVNMMGFKLVGILARGEYDELAVLTIDGSMHCTQIHWMVEEVFKTCKPSCERRHLVYANGEVVEISQEIVKKSRFLSKINKLASLDEH